MNLIESLLLGAASALLLIYIFKMYNYANPYNNEEIRNID